MFSFKQPAVKLDYPKFVTKIHSMLLSCLVCLDFVSGNVLFIVLSDRDTRVSDSLQPAIIHCVKTHFNHDRIIVGLIQGKVLVLSNPNLDLNV